MCIIVFGRCFEEFGFKVGNERAEADAWGRPKFIIFQKLPNFHASFISSFTAPFKFPKLSFILIF